MLGQAAGCMQGKSRCLTFRREAFLTKLAFMWLVTDKPHPLSGDALRMLGAFSHCRLKVSALLSGRAGRTQPSVLTRASVCSQRELWPLAAVLANASCAGVAVDALPLSAFAFVAGDSIGQLVRPASAACCVFMAVRAGRGGCSAAIRVCAVAKRPVARVPGGVQCSRHRRNAPR